jgi:hypothetical protein
MASHHPKALKYVVGLEKVCEDLLRLWKKTCKLVDREKWLKKTRFKVDLVSNLSFLNGDIEITGLVILNFDK